MQNQCSQCGAALSTSAAEGLCPACLLKAGLDTQPAAAFTPPRPEELGRYFPALEILELLGRGGMGVVYKARQRQLDRLVALKILAAPRDPAFAERFAREAQALARLSHPNIVAIHDSGEVEGLYYFLMEYVDGLNLRQVLAAGQVAPSEALAIVPQICDALQFAHNQGIVHRDIKPENILLDKEGRVKIADFGIAKIAGREAIDFALTGTGETIGTPAYMAPEQVERPQQVDHRADIFSLGVVFYQMLTGELPLGRFAPPSRKVQVDIRIDDVVLRALEKEPELRYQRAREVKTDVETITGTPAQMQAVTPQQAWSGVDYRSKAALFGLPLLHVATGIDPATMRKRVARGIIAIGDIAYGVIAMGGLAYGGIAFGGLAVGLFAWGGCGLGLIAYGGCAIALILALGGLAIAPVAIGGAAVGVWADGGAFYAQHVISKPWIERVIFMSTRVTWVFFPFLIAISTLLPLILRARRDRSAVPYSKWLPAITTFVAMTGFAVAMFVSSNNVLNGIKLPGQQQPYVNHPPAAASTPGVTSSATLATAPSAALQRKAVDFAKLLAAEKYADATAQFDAAILAAMPAYKLALVWNQLSTAGGNLLMIGDRPQVKQEAGFDCVYVPLIWERNKADLKIVYDSAGKISGLWVVAPLPGDE